MRRRVRDPRATFVSITRVEVSRDLAHASVFFTRLGIDSKTEASETIRGLDRASGYLRRELAKTFSLRTVPKLVFIFDESIGRGRDMDALLTRARNKDLYINQCCSQSSRETEDGTP